MSREKSDPRYPILFWRSIVDIASSWSVVALAVALAVYHSWCWYPVSALIIANRILALSLLCHEGLHGNIHRWRALNDFVGRYFCAIPTFISFSKYRRLHFVHHGMV